MSGNDGKKVGGPLPGGPPRSRTRNVANNTRPSSMSQSGALSAPADPACWCGEPSKARVEGRVLGGLAILAVPVCNDHIPPSQAEADRLIAVTLLAIAEGVAEADLGVPPGRRRSRRG